MSTYLSRLQWKDQRTAEYTLVYNSNHNISFHVRIDIGDKEQSVTNGREIISRADEYTPVYNNTHNINFHTHHIMYPRRIGEKDTPVKSSLTLLSIHQYTTTSTNFRTYKILQMTHDIEIINCAAEYTSVCNNSYNISFHTNHKQKKMQRKRDWKDGST